MGERSINIVGHECWSVVEWPQKFGREEETFGASYVLEIRNKKNSKVY